MLKIGKGMMGGGKKRWCKIVKGESGAMTNKAQFLIYNVGAPAPKTSFFLAASKIEEDENPRDKKYAGRAFYLEGQGILFLNSK